MCIRDRLYPWFKCPDYDDTFILSSLFNPDRPKPPGCSGSHGLEAWGVRFGVPKPKHEDWTNFSEDMLHRCREDVKINVLTYRYLYEKRTSWDWELAIKIEYTVANIQRQQEDNGVLFDKRKAIDLWIKIVKELHQIDARLLKQLPLRCEAGTEVKKPFLKNGNYAKNTVSYWRDSPEYLDSRKVVGPYSKITIKPFNLNSNDQIKNYLISVGWVPTEWNYKKDGKKWVYDSKGNKIKSSPKITLESLEGLDLGEMGNLLARRAILQHRKNLIYSFSPNKKKPSGLLTNIRPDGRISALANTVAANTGRFRHSVVVNIPKRGLYGEELRSLFIAPDNMVMIGADAKALEARTEAHNCFPFPGGEEYAHDLIDGDVHAKNAAVFGTDRDGAKPGKYSIVYGASVEKFTETIGASPQKGKELYEAFWKSNTALKGFKEAVIKEYRANKKKYGYGFIKGLDGRQLRGRSEHSLVNLKFQSDGAILMKVTECFLFNKFLPKHRVVYEKVLDFHDEFQSYVLPEHQEIYKEQCLKSFIDAGNFFNYNVPIVGDVKIGRNWSECH